jgi:tetratricopeptide (TPR) repeat protein
VGQFNRVVWKMKNIVEISPDLNILILDESPAIKDNLLSILKQTGFRNIFQSTEAHAGLALLRKESIGLVFCNRNLRAMSGIEVLKEFRENMAITSVPFIMVASEITRDDALIGTEFGLDAFLKVPFVPKDVTQKISQVMADYYSPDSVQLQFEMARALYAESAYLEAAESFLELSKKFPKSCRARLGAARSYLKLEQFDKTESLLREAIGINDLYVHAHHELGILYLARGKVEYAMAAFDRAIKISPLNPVRYDTMGELLLERGLFEQAENYLTRAVDLELVYPNIYAQLGKALLSQKKMHKASRYFERALLEDPQNVSFLNSLGICMKELGKYESAVEYYNKAFKLCPKDMKILYNKAICLIAGKELQKAQKVLKQIIATDPKNEKAIQKLRQVELDLQKSA